MGDVYEEFWESRAATPIKMILHCPNCHTQHIDAPEEIPNQPIFKFVPTEMYPHRMEQVGTYTAQGAWTNPPHRSHLCHHCNHIWRPADVATEGVATIETRGEHDHPAPVHLPSVAGVTNALTAKEKP